MSENFGWVKLAWDIMLYEMNNCAGSKKMTIHDYPERLIKEAKEVSNEIKNIYECNIDLEKVSDEIGDVFISVFQILIKLGIPLHKPMYKAILKTVRRHPLLFATPRKHTANEASEHWCIVKRQEKDNLDFLNHKALKVVYEMFIKSKFRYQKQRDKR